MFIPQRDTISPNCLPWKIPGRIVLVRENFAVNKRVCRKETTKIVLRRFCLSSFPNCLFGFHGFYREKLKIIQSIFELARGRNFVVINKECHVTGDDLSNRCGMK